MEVFRKIGVAQGYICWLGEIFIRLGNFYLLVQDTHLKRLGLGLFWLFLFQFRNNKIHGISISRRTLILSENGILLAEVT